MKVPHVAIGGLPYFGQRTASLLRGSSWECRYIKTAGRQPGDWLQAARALLGADVIYLIGGQIERGSRPAWLRSLTHCPIVMHWVGSDVSYARALLREQRSEALISRAVHWAEVPWIAEELLALGIRAEIVPLAAIPLSAAPPPLPERFTVLIYMPDSRRQFYRQDLMMRLAEDLPAAKFLVVGGRGGACACPPNVEYLGWVDDMSSLYRRSSVLLRLPEHDGLSFMVLEALAAGRNVLWNHPLPGVTEVADEASAKVELERLLAQQDAGSLSANEEGRRFVEEEFAPDGVRREILSRFEQLISPVRRPNSLPN